MHLFALHSRFSFSGCVFSEGPFCPSRSDSERTEALIDQRRSCVFKEGPWSECLHCRQLRRRQILREAAGPGVDPCPDVLEMQFCNETCRLQYDFAYTASSTYPPITTLPARLFTVVALTTTLAPLSWRRWFTVERLTTAAWLLVAALLFLFLGLCIFCSFRKNTPETPEPLEYSPDEEIPPPVPTLTSMTRRTTVRIQSAASTMASIVAASEDSGSPSADDKQSRKSHSLAVNGQANQSRTSRRVLFYDTRESTAGGFSAEREKGCRPTPAADGNGEGRESPFGLVPVRCETELPHVTQILPGQDRSKQKNVEISELTGVRQGGGNRPASPIVGLAAPTFQHSGVVFSAHVNPTVQAGNTV